MIMAASAQAQEREQFVVGVNVASWHGPNEFDYPYETWTPGIYVRENKAFFKEVGIVRNSQGFWSGHAGVGYEWDLGHGLDVSVVGGAIYGYRDWLQWVNADGSTFYTYGPPELRGFIIPSVGVEVARNLKVRTMLVPKVGQVDAWAISVGLEGKF